MASRKIWEVYTNDAKDSSLKWGLELSLLVGSTDFFEDFFGILEPTPNDGSFPNAEFLLRYPEKNKKKPPNSLKAVVILSVLWTNLQTIEEPVVDLGWACAVETVIDSLFLAPLTKEIVETIWTIGAGGFNAMLYKS